MKKQFKQLPVLMALFAGLLTGCQKTSLQEKANSVEPALSENDVALVAMPGDNSSPSTARRSSDKYNTFYGPQVQMGNGHVRSWINITHAGVPLAIGLEMTDGALDNLPHDVTDHEGAPFNLKLHQKAKAVTPFDHITVDWNPMGHPPANVYDPPHFDFHFYKMSLMEQMEIPPYEVAPAKFDLAPPQGYIPTAYMNFGGCVPKMGAHWIDLMTPEVQQPGSPNYHPFTSTFIYGSYDGKVTFLEPMVTHAVMEEGSTTHLDFRQPMYFSPTGVYYPSRYNIWQDKTNGRHYVSLDNMVLR
jgi:hypothetical protein